MLARFSDMSGRVCYQTLSCLLEAPKHSAASLPGSDPQEHADSESQQLSALPAWVARAAWDKSACMAAEAQPDLGSEASYILAQEG